VPSAWTLDEPIDERCAVQGVFVKQLAGTAEREESRPTWLFAARRLAWHPAGLLGDAGMDMGLLDAVSDRTRLTEREAFYQMLAAVRRMPAQEIVAAGRQELRVLRKHLRQMADDRDLRGKQRVEILRALARAERDTSDVVPLFNDPASQRGKLVMLRGEAMRAIEVRVDDPDIVERLGIDHYYEVEIFTPDSQSYPIVCCVAELPPGMPLGERIREPVSLAGFFLKSWAYGAAPRDSESNAEISASRRQSAPLVIARTLDWTPSPGASGPEASIVVAIVGALVATLLALWFVARGERRANLLADDDRKSLPERIDLEAIRASGDLHP
jgi:hypothetical protein